MPAKVRVGVVGTSDWTDWMYLSNLATHPRAELAALCGRDQNRATEVAGRYGIPQVFADYHEMIARGDAPRSTPRSTSSEGERTCQSVSGL